MREKAGVAAGDEIDVELELDTKPRQVSLPKDFQKLLDRDARIKAAFAALSFSKKQALVLPIEAAKAADTRERRIQRALALLTAAGRI